MSPSNGLPGPESHAETTDPRTEGITPGDLPEARTDVLGAVNIPLPPVWRGPDGHDEWCESYWDDAAKMWHPCGCVYRVLTGAYPDGQRGPG
jgi:hypothetical protein